MADPSVLWRNEPVNDSWVDAYLVRIGAERPARPDAEALRELPREVAIEALVTSAVA